MARSVRLDPELETQLARAAEVEGLSASDFIREAVRERSARVLGRTLHDELADVIGALPPHKGAATIAERTGAAFTDLLLRKRVARTTRAQP